jgi:hypothetical protein
MSDLQKQLDETLGRIKQMIPADMFGTMLEETEKLKDSGIEGKAVQTGDKAPDFTLTNHLGQDRNLASMLQGGPVVVSFYRGGW